MKELRQMGKKFVIMGILFAVLTLSYPLAHGAGKNYIVNPSFEKTIQGKPSTWEMATSNLKDTEFIVEQGAGHGGNRFATIINHTACESRYWKWITVEEFKKYKLTVWVKTENVGMDKLGAYVSIEGIMSDKIINGTSGQWERVELYLQTGKEIYLVALVLGLGAYDSLNTGKVSFDDLSLEPVDTIPADAITAIIGEFKDSKGRLLKPSSILPSTFNAVFMFWLFVMIVAMIILTVKDPAPKRDKLSAGLLYLLLAAVLFMLFGIYLTTYTLVSTTVVQLFFMAVLVSAGMYGLISRKNGQWKKENLIVIIIILGIALRLCYFLYTSYDIRQHDVLGGWGHADYIKYIAAYWSLPPSGDYQLYHPPVHHLIAAAGYSLGKWMGLDEPLSWRMAQLIMVFLSSLTLIFFYKILKLLNCGSTAKTLGTAIFAFHPSNVYFGAFINNDNTLLFFYVLTFYFLIRWLQNHSTQNAIWLALMASLTILTKKSAVILLPVIFLAVLITVLKDRTHIKMYVRQAGIFLLTFIPGFAVYPLRNLYLFHQGWNFAPAMTEELSNRLSVLFSFSIKSLAQTPFTNFEMDYVKQTGGFIAYLVRSSLFGEWEFSGLEFWGTILMVVALINWANLILLLGHYYLSKKISGGKKYDYLFWFNIILLCVLVFNLRLKSPSVCAQNFRYMAPILISVSYLWGQSVQRLDNVSRKLKWWKYGSISLAVVFCAVATLFILMIGV